MIASENNKSRIQYIDLAKGFCIILVVLHHVESSMGVHFWFDTYYRAFFMPLFFLLSGLFFKPYENFYGFTIRKANKLLIPFLFFFIFTAVLPTISLKIFGFPHFASIKPFNASTIVSFIWPEQFANVPIWFLWCLFIMNFMFYGICLLAIKLTSKCQKLFALSVSLMCFTIGVSGYIIVKNDINIPAFIDSAMVAMPFFGLGFVLNKHTTILVNNKYDKFNLIVVLMSIIILYLLTTGNINYRTNSYKVNIVQLYLVGFFGSFSVLFLSKIIHELPLISWWGKYSLIILVTHDYVMQIGIFISKRLLGTTDVAFVLAVVLTMLSYIAIIPFMKKYLGYFTAQKDIIPVKANYSKNS